MRDKSVLITGAAGALGKAIVKKFSAEGWKVFAADSQPVEYCGCTCIKFDPRCAETDAQCAVDEIGRAGYTVDAVVCADRKTGGSVTATELSLETWEELLRHNVFSCYMISRCAVKSMIASGKRGSIVFVGDVCYKGAVPGKCAYTSSMGALVSMTRGLALDFAPHGICVNCVLPGPLAEGNRQAQSKSVPLGALTTPEQVASTAFFLACGEAGNTTGASLVVDGGMDCLVPGAF